MKVTIFKTVGERRIEGATWGLLLVWVGVAMFWDEPKGLASAVAGGILLVSALIQKALGYEAGIVLWVAGLALSISGLNDLLDRKGIHLSALGIVLVIIGGLIVVRSLGAGKRQHLRDVSHRFGRPRSSDQRPPDIDI